MTPSDTPRHWAARLLHAVSKQPWASSWIGSMAALEIVIKAVGK